MIDKTSGDLFSMAVTVFASGQQDRMTYLISPKIVSKQQALSLAPVVDVLTLPH